MSQAYYLKAVVLQKHIDDKNCKHLFNKLVFTFFANKRCQGTSSKFLDWCIKWHFLIEGVM